MEFNKKKVLLLIASILIGMGGWIASLGGWEELVTPVQVGGGLAILGSIIAAWLGQSPINQRGGD